MNLLEIIISIVVIAHAIFSWKMYHHILANQSDKKWIWLYIFYLTGGLASIYYYLAYKRPMDLEKKKFSSY